MTSMKMMMVILMITLFGLVSIFQLTHAGIYKWVDEKGTVNFTYDPATIPEKYKNQVESTETTEDKMTIDEKLRENRLQEQRARENMERQRRQHEKEEEYTQGEKRFKQAVKDFHEETLRKEREFKEKLKALKEVYKEEKGKIKTPCMYNQAKNAYQLCYHVTADGKCAHYGEACREVGHNEQKVDTNPGAIDVRTGEFYPGVAGGIINPRTGEFMPDVGGGYIDPKTGRFIPKQ